MKQMWACVNYCGQYMWVCGMGVGVTSIPVVHIDTSTWCEKGMGRTMQNQARQKQWMIACIWITWHAPTLIWYHSTSSLTKCSTHKYLADLCCIYPSTHCGQEIGKCPEKTTNNGPMILFTRGHPLYAYQAGQLHLGLPAVPDECRNGAWH